ncbi:serine/threonine-protein phosphatase 6 regulatory ankyrin repeat subunit C-like isoform X1 [Diorhabda carinulata]|uniref:serine/threonine-protein phosphatase 6 regulatory ankyrin repeat subunit C-like isoform X1 n=2 Tax=Diorhabda carinulata TaxID=1163345 RepID=UPI0025A259AB|nr:serine/threonine-protein phosphatase 6 regulatory ankyrin repeat subunit C-like isoform X1 [Diorhabda carinulata]
MAEVDETFYNSLACFYYHKNENSYYNDTASFNGVLRATLTENIEELNRYKKRKGGLNSHDQFGNTPLHVAAIRNKLKSVMYLIDQPQVSVHAKNSLGQTPIFHSAQSGYVEITAFLIAKGADVNAQNCMKNTPLHLSVLHPPIMRLLIENGADLNMLNLHHNTPIYNAVSLNCLEVVCMLLYYNCDPTVKNIYKRTPLIKAIMCKNSEIQDALFDYTDDFNDIGCEEDSVLTLALTYKSPYLKQILSKGTSPTIDDVIQSLFRNNYRIFKKLWRMLPRKELNTPRKFGQFADEVRRRNVMKYIDIVLKHSDDYVFERLAYCFDSFVNLNAFLDVTVDDSGLNQITKFVCALLQYDCRFSAPFVYDLYVYFGYCDLFKYFLYIDQIDYPPIYCVEWIIPKYIFNIRSDIRYICHLVNSNYRQTNNVDVVLKTLEFSADSCLVDLVRKYKHCERCIRLSYMVPTVPSLLELAREKTRQYIVDKYNFFTPSQFYTFINDLDINNVYKKILRWEQPIYFYNI